MTSILKAGPLVAVILFPVSAQQFVNKAPQARPHLMETYGKLPLSFEANHGQTDRRVKFLSRGSGYTLFLTQDSAVLSLHGKTTNAALRMKVIGANPHAAVVGTDGLPGKSNYFVGKDPKQWRTNVPTYASVKYTEVYPGIDLVYHGNQRLLEYDFMVAPGADPRAIELRFQGAKKLTVNPAGALVIGLGGDEVIEHAPVVYQEVGGQRQTVRARYVLRDKGRVGFNVAEYDRNLQLVIDPTLVYSTYLGGNGNENGLGMAVDAAGSVFITGATGSANFPTTLGSFKTKASGAEWEAFVSKLNAAGTSLIYSTYLGGSGGSAGLSLAVDTAGNVYVTGTANDGFPTTPGAFQTSCAAPGNAFVSKLDAAGSSLIYSTYLGASTGGGVGGNSIAVDPSGNAYVTGYTSSFDFPTTVNAFQTTLHASSGVTAFVSKLNAAGSALVYSTYLGGNYLELGTGIAVDALGSAYVVGSTGSSDFPTTSAAFQPTLHGARNAFITKLNATGSGLIYSTYLGGSWYDWAYGISLDAGHNAYVTGEAGSSDFPTTPSALQSAPAGTAIAAFTAKVNSTGSALLYSTYLGGMSGASGRAVTVDASGDAYVTGYAYAGFPTTSDAFQSVFGGGDDVFISKLNPIGSALLYSSYLGGADHDEGYGIAIDASGNVYMAGTTSSSDFPITGGAMESAFGGGANDSFVAKLNLGSVVSTGPVTAASLSGPAGNNGWSVGPVTVTLNATAGSSPVSATYYKVDNGAYQAYGAPFQITGDGIHQLAYYSVDTAGNQETPHGQTMKIDSSPPVSHVAALPGTASSPNFSVQWSGSDATSGLVNYTIYVSDGTGFTPWLSQTTATQAWYTGYLGHTYRFYSAARDVAGNVEVKTIADATTTVPAQMAADTNGDGQINCTDIAIVKASFGKRTGQTGFDPRADVNHDGIVDIRDLAAVSQKLIPGTTCP
ncbi:MAG TPA: SBBP repeat-containing protein [Bryobacteraceae bacterium]|nr:SBBP repeat-containing protein [Bryobacteraceae bacterium]